jgi:isoleucyl-tRNA synthetase
MSKSLGNVTNPQEVADKFGADILRLWVVSSDYSEDLRIGPEILKHQGELYRRLRNTLRYLLGALAGFSDAERVEPGEMPELERWVLHRLAELDALLRRTVADPNADEYFRFTAFYTALHNFCAVDLSAFYFDIRKDSLYCDRPDTLRRRATRTVMDQVFNCLTAWLAPVLCFTAEEAWLTRHPNGDSVHLRLFPEVPAAWRDEALSRKWDQIRDVRRVVTGALELARADKKIGSSLQAAPVLFTEPRYDAALEGLDLDEVSITSGLERQPFGGQPPEHFALPDVPGVAVAFRVADGEKCERCWRVLPEVGKDKSHPSLCIRCSDAVEHLRSAAE